MDYNQFEENVRLEKVDEFMDSISEKELDNFKNNLSGKELYKLNQYIEMYEFAKTRKRDYVNYEIDFLSIEELMDMELIAIEYGYSSLNSFINSLIVRKNNDDDFEDIIMKQKQSYYEVFDNYFLTYSEDKRVIIRTAHFYYTSILESENSFHSIHDLDRTRKKYLSAKKIIMELFNSAGTDLETIKDVSSSIESAIENATTSKAMKIIQNKALQDKRVNSELDKLEISAYEKKDILESFKIILNI